MCPIEALERDIKIIPNQATDVRIQFLFWLGEYQFVKKWDRALLRWTGNIPELFVYPNVEIPLKRKFIVRGMLGEVKVGTILNE